jgi:flavin-dependent dehydrogenase
VAKALRELYDLVVVGAGPAGSAAALHASQQKTSVLVVEQEKFPRAQALLGWLGPAGVTLCKEFGVGVKKAAGAEFKGLRLHSWDLKRNTFVEDADLRGWLVNRSAFDDALLTKARQAGAQLLHGVVVEHLSLGEQRAILRLSDGREVAGQVVLVADGAASPTAQKAKLACAGQHRDMPQCMLVQYEAAETAVRLDVAVGAGRAGQIATIARLGKLVDLRITAHATQTPIEEQFREFCDAASHCGLLPAGGPLQPVRALCPRGVALDMDTHVGKRCLLIGEAGGFVAAFSNEGIYPAMRSGWLAAETALRALRAPLLQDELASFGVTWRSDLADYLRMPNTDLGLLMPLVFNNAQMSRRVARAFLLGQPF